ASSVNSTSIRIPAELEQKMDEAIGRYPADQRRSGAMPLLHLWQEHFGFISDKGVQWIAAKLGIEPINILELVTFYPMFRRERAGKTHIRVCRTLSCAMAGSYQLMENFRAATGIERRHQSDGMRNPISISADGNYSVEFVECLASCGTAPVCMVNDKLHETVSPEFVANIVSNPKSEIRNPKSPHPLEHRLIFKNIGRDDWKIDIATYLRDGGYEQLQKAITMSREQIVNEVKTSGLRGRGAGAYICGEETGLIESLEGKRAYPRIKPPYFPAVLGLYMCPTIVNNVETLCHVKHIIAMGGATYARLGRPNNTGTRIVCVSGD